MSDKNEKVLAQTLQLSGEILQLLSERGFSFSEMGVICRSAAGTADALRDGELMAITYANILRKE